jgi:hypothetical protein
MICCWSDGEGELPRARLMSAPPGGGGGDPGRFDIVASSKQLVVRYALKENKLSSKTLEASREREKETAARDKREPPSLAHR